MWRKWPNHDQEWPKGVEMANCDDKVDDIADMRHGRPGEQES